MAKAAKSTLISINAYAKRCGVRVFTIQTAVKQGRITTTPGPNGKPMIDPVRADKEFKKNTDPSKQNRKKDSPQPKEPPPETEDDSEDESQEAYDAEGNVIPKYHKSREAREHWLAKTAEVEYKEKIRELVPITEVKTAWSSIITNVKTKLLAVPTKCRGHIPHLTPEEIDIIDKIIREALEDLGE